MNCAECRDNLVACAEGLLDREASLECQAHLETCASCCAEFEAITKLQQRLINRGETASELAIVEPVMQRIRKEQFIPERETIMSRMLKHSWAWGFGAAAAALLIAVIVGSAPNVQAKAAEVLTKGAQAIAKLTTIHLRGQLRTLPADNFSYIDYRCDFAPIELWKEFDPELKWRVDKPGRKAVMNGKTTVLYINANNSGYKINSPTQSAFDTAWLHMIANLSSTITNELFNAQKRGWKLELEEKSGSDGRIKSIVTVHAMTGLPDTDHLKNAFFDIADTRRVYHFDTGSELLEAVQVYLVRPEGEVLIFDLNQIEYNQPLTAETWQLSIPADVTWERDPQVLPDNQKYAAMTAEQAARAFFEACGREDWTEVEKFVSTLTPSFKQYLGGIQIISLGESFSSQVQNTNLQRFVPYEIKLRPQDMYLRLSNSNQAKRFVLTAQLDSNMKVEEDFKWTTEPPVLAADDVCAKMSPAEVAKALFDASRKLDWDTIAKIVPESTVTRLKQQVTEAQKAGIDVRKLDSRNGNH